MLIKAIGVGTVGVDGLACLIIVGGVAGYTGSEVGSYGGEFLGGKIYEAYGE